MWGWYLIVIIPVHPVVKENVVLKRIVQNVSNQQKTVKLHWRSANALQELNWSRIILTIDWDTFQLWLG